MEDSRMKISARKLVPVLVHIVLWTMWIALPILNAGDNERFRLINIWMIPINLTHIPLFLINSEWLIPKVYAKKELPTYLISLILLGVAFTVLQYFMKYWIVPQELMHNGPSLFFTIMPVLFMLGISTGYGLIVYQNRQDKIRQEEQQMRLKSELSFLRSQISPHFIFNILNSIVYLIRSKSDRAEEVTLKLSELMRYMLYTSEDEQVPLDMEINYLKNYIALQKVRFDEDVSISLNIEGSLGGQRIEPMLLIPFVENAFKHGVGMIAEPIIGIDLRVDSDRLNYQVKNKISRHPTEEKDANSGIGIRNVKRRLELLYPGSHKLEITEKEGWFVVNMSLDFAPHHFSDTHTKLNPHEIEMPGRRR